MLRFSIPVSSVSGRTLAKTKFTTKRTLRASGAALLLVCLLALVLGVFGAVYFEQNQPSAPQVASKAPPPPPPVPMASAPPEAAAQPPAPTQAPENSQASQAVVPPESQPAPPPPQTAEAQAAPASPSVQTPSASAPPPDQAAAAPSPEPPASVAQSLAQISPSAAPANVASAAPRYWVEFGAYDTSFYADRLKQNLDKLGIAATVREAPGRHGRRYLRVRGADQGDRAAALGQRDEARRALGISPLLHRIAAVNPGATRTAKTRAKGAHWVQFGAFHSPRGADGMVAQLRKNNIQASVLKTKSNSKESLYLVRVSGLSDRAAAAQVAHQGAAALHSNNVLIGESLRGQPPPR